MNPTISYRPPPTYVEGWSDSESIKQIQYNRLGQTDLLVSLISFGAAHVGRNMMTNDENHQQQQIPQSVIEAIYEAIRLGINLVDTSPYYGMGLSEIIVGEVKCFFLS
ncbi:aldo-keto reductase-like protein [Euroglyphus maynei]|uniref:Aldo-keto reductase-like protein n=1 Tax=Euroglyphus maynei TaxID=6958 RepID=A0A1Y3BCV6_EURMA|nr:aldo-keto reductase-like protein [Euroglyphus maynei]